MDRVFIITGLRIQALRMVNAKDFTYSKGYLGLLSTLGASLGIIFCCAPALPVVYHSMRKKLNFPRSRVVQTDEETANPGLEIPSLETPSPVPDPMIDDDPLMDFLQRIPARPRWMSESPNLAKQIIHHT